MIKTVAQNLILLANGVYDTQLAITQILLRNNWEVNNLGKTVKKVKNLYQNTPKLFILETIQNKMFVKDNTGKVVSKVELGDAMTIDQIMNAAKVLNNGVTKPV
jgi:hypothetical protein